MAAAPPEIRLTIRFENDGDGWVTAQIVEVPGAISQGHTRAEARENVIDALRTVLTPDDAFTEHQSTTDNESLVLAVS